MPYRVGYSPEADDHIRSLTARQRAIVLDGIEKHLFETPTEQARNRKRLRPNPIAFWELRLGDIRVYYDAEEDVVTVVAVGVRRRERVWIGSEVVDP